MPQRSFPRYFLISFVRVRFRKGKPPFSALPKDERPTGAAKGIICASVAEHDSASHGGQGRGWKRAVAGCGSLVGRSSLPKGVRAYGRTFCANGIEGEWLDTVGAAKPRSGLCYWTEPKADVRPRDSMTKKTLINNRALSGGRGKAFVSGRPKRGPFKRGPRLSS